MLYSCNKEKQNKVIDNAELKQNPIVQKIVDFRDKVDVVRANPFFKNGETMEVDSVVWYLEAISNYTYSNAGYDFESKLTDSSFVSVPVTNSMVSLVDFQTTYDDIIEILSDYNESIPTTDKQFLVVDVSLKEAQANSALFKVTYSFGTKDVTDFTNDYPWYWGWELGRCDGSGLGVGQDASDIISLLANNEINIPSGTAFYVNVTLREAYPQDFLDNNGNPLLFEDYQEVNLIHTCLSVPEINNFKNNVIYIGQQMKPQYKSVIDYAVEDWTIFGLTDPGNEDYWYMIHHLYVTYAMWIVKADDEVRELPIN